jgi:hypothetical protein
MDNKCQTGQRTEAYVNITASFGNTLLSTWAIQQKRKKTTKINKKTKLYVIAQFQCHADHKLS